MFVFAHLCLGCGSVRWTGGVLDTPGCPHGSCPPRGAPRCRHSPRRSPYSQSAPVNTPCQTAEGETQTFHIRTLMGSPLPLPSFLTFPVPSLLALHHIRRQPFTPPPSNGDGDEISGVARPLISSQGSRLSEGYVHGTND